MCPLPPPLGLFAVAETRDRIAGGIRMAPWLGEGFPELAQRGWNP